MSEQEPDFLDEVAIGHGEQEAPETPEPETPEPVAETVETPPPAATTAPEVSEEHTVPYAAMKAEREKRQRLEQELANVRQQQQPQVDFYQQPDVYVQQHLQQAEQRAQQRFIAALEEQARETYPDFDEVVNDVVEQAEGNPVLAQQVMGAANPVLAAYRLGKQMRELKQMQDPDAYRARIEAEVRASVEAELREKEAQRARAAAAIPPDLTDARNAKGQFAPVSDSVLTELFPKT